MATSKYSSDLNNYGREFFYWELPVETEKTLTDIKTMMREDVRSIAHQLLVSTDWYVTRKVERSVDIPENVSTYRASVISICQQRMVRIDAATDTENFYNTCSDFSDIPWPQEINI